MSRLDLLAQIREQVGERLEDGRVQGRMTFCIEDGARLGPEAREPAGYRHGSHFHRARSSSTPSAVRVPARRRAATLCGGRAAVAGGRGRARCCLFRRRMHPTGYYTLPAGHLELGETPDLTLRREVYEETGLAVLSAELLFEGELPDDCRRRADYHYWRVPVPLHRGAGALQRVGHRRVVHACRDPARPAADLPDRRDLRAAVR